MSPLKSEGGRAYLRRTQPEVWEVAFEMSSVLAADFTDKSWRERVFMLDSFVCELITEMKGADGLEDLSKLPIAELLPEGDAVSDEAGQVVASVRAILTAALLDLPLDEVAGVASINGAEQALIALLSELPEHNEAGRAWAAVKGIEPLLETLKALTGVSVLLIADRAGANTIEPLTTIEALRGLVAEALNGNGNGTVH